MFISDEKENFGGLTLFPSIQNNSSAIGNALTVISPTFAPVEEFESAHCDKSILVIPSGNSVYTSNNSVTVTVFTLPLLFKIL